MGGLGSLLTNLLAALTKKLLLIAAVLVLWITWAILPNGVSISLAKMVLGLNNDYVGREKWLLAYWTGDDPTKTK